MKLIPKDPLVAEIENLLDKVKYHEEYDCAYRDGNNDALYTLKEKIDTLEVKDVDLEKNIEKYFQDWQDCCDDGSAVTPDLLSPSLSEIKEIAKHFFELGLNASNSTTAADRGLVEEIITHLKRVENDYKIDLTKEIEWLRNQVKKGE